MLARQVEEVLPSLETSDPSELLSGFRSSEGYKTEYDRFFQGKQLAGDVTEEDKRMAFEGDETARKVLLNYAKDTGVTFRYDGHQYSQEFQNRFNEYIGCLKDYMKSRFPDAESLKTFDWLRGSSHDAAARVLAEELGVPVRLSRGIVQLIAIGKNLETFDKAGQDERRRLIASLN